MCHLDYCNILWGKASPSLLEQIKSFQKKALHIACGAKYNAHADPLFAYTNSLKFDDLVNFNLAKLGSRLVKNRVPPGLQTAFSLSMPTGHLRSQGVVSIQTPTCRTGATQRIVPYTVPQLYNSLPGFYKEGDTLKLDMLYKSSIIDKYQSFECSKNKCYVCNKVK